MTLKFYASLLLFAAAAVGQIPNVSSMTPASGSGTGATFQFVVPNYPNLSTFNSLTVVIKPYSASATPLQNEIIITYNQVQSSPNFWTTYLWNDQFNSAAQGGAEGQFYTWGNNSYGSISAGSSHSVSGNTLTFNIPVTFKSPIYGPITIFTSVSDTSGANSGWASWNGWTAGAVSPPTVSLTGGPSSASLVGSFSAIINDPMGASDINYTEVYVGNVGGGEALNCLALLMAGTGYLLNDAQNAWVPLTNGYVQNGQCNLQAPTFSQATNSQTYGFTLAVTGNLAGGNYQLYALSAGNIAGNGPWAASNIWPIPAPLGPLTATHTTTDNQINCQYDDYTGTCLVPPTADIPTLGLITSTTSNLDPLGAQVHQYDTFTTTLQGAPPGSTVFVTVKPADAVYPCDLTNGNPQVCTPPSTDVNWCGETPSIYTGAWAFCGPPGAQQTGIVGSDGTFTMNGGFQGMRATIWSETWLVVFSTDGIGRYLGTAYNVVTQ